MEAGAHWLRIGNVLVNPRHVTKIAFKPELASQPEGTWVVEVHLSDGTRLIAAKVSKDEASDSLNRLSILLSATVISK